MNDANRTAHEIVIKDDRCDFCHRRNVGVEHVLCGMPVLFQCRPCNPKLFDRAAETLVGEVLADLLG